MTEDEYAYLWKRRNEIKVRALTNRLYQQERQRIFELREGAVKAASIFASSVAFANLSSPEIVKGCIAIVTAGSIAALVFGFGNKARDSVKRGTEWAQLERDIDYVGERDFTETHLNQWAARAHEIESGEPAAHKGLLERCYLRACNALGAQPTGKSLWWHRVLPPILIP